MRDDDGDNDCNNYDSDEENNEQLFVYSIYVKLVIKSISWSFDYSKLNFLVIKTLFTKFE